MAQGSVDRVLCSRRTRADHKGFQALRHAIVGSEDSEIHVQGVENYDIGESSDEESGEENSSDKESESESEQSDIESESEDEESESDGDEGNDSEKRDASEENAAGQKKKRNQKKPVRRATRSSRKSANGKETKKVGNLLLFFGMNCGVNSAKKHTQKSA